MSKPTTADILKAAGKDHLPIVEAGHIARHIGKAKNEGPPKGLEPPYQLLKKAIQKIVPTHLWLVGGYTSHGKSLFSIDLAMRLMMEANPAIAIFSTEMACMQYTYRIIAWLTGIPSLRLMYGTMNEKEFDWYNKACETLQHANIYLYDDLYKWKDIEKTCEALKKHRLDIVIIDYVQQLAGKGSIYERMSQVASDIQQLPKKLDMTLLALSQVPDWAAKEKDAEVIGFKGAGELAAAADLGLWLQKKKKENIVNVAVRKNRHGQTGKRAFKFVDKWTRLEEQPETTNGISSIEDD